LFGIEHLVMIEGFLDEEELGNRLLASSGLVFPSLYEGFGIPLVDALKLGIPILASRSASIPEVCGQACSYFGNARNALAVADDLEAFWQDEDRRAHQKRNGLRQGARYSSRKMASEISRVITDTIGTAREEASNAGASFNFVPPQRRRLAVFVAYEENDGLDGIREVSDIHRYHIGLFGEAASITVGLDLRLAEDKRVAALFRKAPNLIAFDATTMEGRDAAVYDFSTRYDDAEYHLVVKHPSSAVKYSPSRLDEMLTALELHPRAGFAILDPEVADIIVEAPPTEREGCLRYETIREAGFAVYDRLIRRAGVLRGLSNGTAQFLSVIATRAELLRFPWLSGTVEHN
jgi:hypothetical protein